MKNRYNVSETGVLVRPGLRDPYGIPEKEGLVA
jgi:hypothetical protein